MRAYHHTHHTPKLHAKNIYLPHGQKKSVFIGSDDDDGGGGVVVV